MEDKNGEYNKKIKRIENLFLKYPDTTNQELGKTINNIENICDKNSVMNQEPIYNDKEPMIDDKNKIVLIVCLLFVLNAALCFFANDKVVMYLAGLAFFAAGIFVGLKAKGIGLVFLFSHGGVGLGLMLFSLLEKVLNNAIMQDNPKNINICLGIITVIVVVATIYAIIYNLSNENKRSKFGPIIIIGLYTVAIIVAALLSKFYMVIY